MVSGEAPILARLAPIVAATAIFNSRRRGFLWAAVTVTIFSGWFVVTRHSVTRALQVWDIAALRFGIGAVLLAPAVLRRGSRVPIMAWGKGLLFAALWGLPYTRQSELVGILAPGRADSLTCVLRA